MLWQSGKHGNSIGERNLLGINALLDGNAKSFFYYIHALQFLEIYDFVGFHQVGCYAHQSYFLVQKHRSVVVDEIQNALAASISTSLSVG